MRFTGAGPQTQSALDSRVRQCKTRRRVIASEKVNEVMRFSQSAVGKEKRRVARDRLLEQTRGLEKIFLQPRIETCGGAKSFGSQIKIVGHQVARGSFLDGCFFRRGELSVQLIGDRLCDFALNGEDVIKWTVIVLRPQMRISARIDQLRGHAHSATYPLYTSFQDICHPKLLAYFAQIAEDAALVLHNRSATDDFEIGDFCQIG